jgi:hypothetical protein
MDTIGLRFEKEGGLLLLGEWLRKQAFHRAGRRAVYKIQGNELQANGCQSQDTIESEWRGISIPAGQNGWMR